MSPVRLRLFAAPALIVAVVVALVVSLVVTPFLGIPLGLAAGALVVWWLARRVDERVIEALGARRVAEGEYERLVNVVDGICVSHGFAEPELWAVASTARNACVVAGGEGLRLVVTDGLVDGCDLLALEAVVAQQLSLAAEVDVDGLTAVAGMAGLVPDAIRERLAARCLPEQHRIRADLSGARLTRYPPGLASALEFARAGRGELQGAQATAPLWLIAPAESAGSSGPDPTESADTRISILREL